MLAGVALRAYNEAWDSSIAFERNVSAEELI
jgi:hypothetical protein